jgi:hypothetical protein
MSDDEKVLLWARKILNEHGLSDWSVRKCGQTCLSLSKKEVRICTKKTTRSFYDLDGNVKRWEASRPYVGIALIVARAVGGGKTIGCSIVRETFFQIIDKHFQKR